MFCYECGYIGEENGNQCPKCGATLVDFKTPPPFLNEYLFRLQRGAADFREGKITKDAFKEIVDYIDDRFHEACKSIEQIMDEDGEYQKDEMGKKEITLGFGGAQLFNEGLNLVYLFFKNEDFSYLDSGLESIEEGNRFINEAIALNFKNFAMMAEDIEKKLIYMKKRNLIR